MKPKKLYVRNFLGLREIDLEFVEGITVVEGPNGAGKSSIFEAIMFALFGTGIRYGGRNPYDYVNSSSIDKEARIELLFERGGREYKLVRVLDARKKNHWAVLKDERANLVLASRVDQVNNEVKRILGFSDDVFRRTVYLPQGEIDRFLKATRGEISETVLQVLYGDTIERVSEKIKERLESVSKDFAVLQERYSSLLRELSSFDLESKREERRKLERYREELEKKLNDLREREKVLSSILQSVKDYSSKKRELEELKRLRDALQKKVETEGRIKKAKELLPAYRKILDLKNEEKRLEKRIFEFVERKEALEKNVKRLEEKISVMKGKLGNLLEESNAVERSIEEKRRIVEASRPLLEEANVLKDRLRGIDYQIRKIEEKIERKEEDLKRKGEELGFVERKLEEVRELLKENEEGYLNYLAHEVAKRLKVGEICPVCGGTFKGKFGKTLTIESGFYEDLLREERELEKKKAVLERVLKDGEGEIKRYEEELAEREKEKKDALERLEVLQKELEKLGYFPELEGELKDLEEKRKRKQEEFRRLEDEMVKLERETVYASAELKETERSLSEVSAEKEGIMRRLSEEETAFFKALSDQGLSFEDFIELSEADIDENTSSKLAEVNAKIEHIASDLERLESQIREFDLETLRRRYEEIVREIERTEEERKRVLQEMGRIDQLIENLEVKAKEIPEVEKRLEQVGRQKRLLELAKNSFKKDEFPSFCTARILRNILERTNQYLSVMMDGRFGLEFTEEKGFVVLDNGVQRRAEGLSGGERALISIALAISFAEAIAGRLEAFFIDEGFSSLDSDNKRKMAAILKELEKLNKVIVFVTHDREFSEEFERRIRVVGGRKA